MKDEENFVQYQAMKIACARSDEPLTLIQVRGMMGLFAQMVNRENEMKINARFKLECLKVGGSVVPIADTQNFSCIVGQEKV